MAALSSISRLHSVIESNLFMTTGNLDYDRVTDAIISLCDAIDGYCCAAYRKGKDYDDDIWSIGELTYASLDSLLAGAYWHYTEWHNGQWSKGYAALCSIDDVFQPAITSGPEPDSCERDVYLALHDMAASELSAQLQA